MGNVDNFNNFGVKRIVTTWKKQNWNSGDDVYLCQGNISARCRTGSPRYAAGSNIAARSIEMPVHIRNALRVFSYANFPLLFPFPGPSFASLKSPNSNQSATGTLRFAPAPIPNIRDGRESRGLCLPLW